MSRPAVISWLLNSDQSLCEILNLTELYLMTGLRKLVEDALKVEAIKLMEREYRKLKFIGTVVIMLEAKNCY